MNNKILVTGAAGFIGYHTVIKLLDLGYMVVGIDNLNNYYDVKLKKARLSEIQKHKNSKNFVFIKCDFSNYKILEKKLEKYNFNKIIHLGGQAGVRYSTENPSAYAQANYIGTMNIFEFARHYEIGHVVYASTSSVYGKNEKKLFEESDQTDNPVSIYAATKKATEVLAHAYSDLFGIKMTGLRFFTVYGPWGRPDMALFKFTKNILADKKIEVYNKGKMKRSFTYVTDIVDGIVASLDANKKYSIYNLGGSKSINLLDFIKIIEKNLNKKADIIWKEIQMGDVKETLASGVLAKKDLKYNPKIEIKEGVKKFVEWFIKNKKLCLGLKDK